jgi:hypothetical protein
VKSLSTEVGLDSIIFFFGLSTSLVNDRWMSETCTISSSSICSKDRYKTIMKIKETEAVATTGSSGSGSFQARERRSELQDANPFS